MPKLIQAYVQTLTRIAQNRFNLATWWVLAVITFVITRLLQTWLDASYANSQFPVPFYIGQTTFDAHELKGYFEVLINKGTLDIFVTTQLIDYVFMVGTFISFFCLASAVMRSLLATQVPQWLIKIALFFVCVAPLAAVMDAIENLISFVMLSDPLHFADWLVYPYSSFAVIKFAIFACTYLWSLVAAAVFLLTLLYRVIRRSVKNVNLA